MHNLVYAKYRFKYMSIAMLKPNVQMIKRHPEYIRLLWCFTTNCTVYRLTGMQYTKRHVIKTFKTSDSIGF